MRPKPLFHRFGGREAGVKQNAEEGVGRCVKPVHRGGAAGGELKLSLEGCVDRLAGAKAWGHDSFEGFFVWS